MIKINDSKKDHIKLQVLNSLKSLENLHLNKKTLELKKTLKFCTIYQNEIDDYMLLKVVSILVLIYQNKVDDLLRYISKNANKSELNNENLFIDTYHILLSTLKLLLLWSIRFPKFYNQNSIKLKWTVSKIYSSFGLMVQTSSKLLSFLILDQYYALLSSNIDSLILSSLLLAIRTSPFSPYIIEKDKKTQDIWYLLQCLFSNSIILSILLDNTLYYTQIIQNLASILSTQSIQRKTIFSKILIENFQIKYVKYLKLSHSLLLYDYFLTLTSSLFTTEQNFGL